jgi:hypothetical protein
LSLRALAAPLTWRTLRTRQLREESPDAALRKEEAKARVKAQKEQQAREAQAAATAKILSGDTSKKKQAAKALKDQEARAAAAAGAARYAQLRGLHRFRLRCTDAAVALQERLAERRGDVPPKPGMVRIKRGAGGSLVAFAQGEEPYWAAAR